MSDSEHIGWPWTESGPIVDAPTARRGRVSILSQMKRGENRPRPTMGIGVPDIIFELASQAVEFSLRVAIRENLRIHEPGAVVPPGPQGVRLVIDESTGANPKKAVVIRYIDAEFPKTTQDPLTVRLTRG